jgi:hypothetical protein
LNNRAKLELCEAALERARVLLVTVYVLNDTTPAVLLDLERALGALQPKGAIARCSHCQRYSARTTALSRRLMLRCDCGMLDGWSGSFPRPTAESTWSISGEWVRR